MKKKMAQMDKNYPKWPGGPQVVKNCLKWSIGPNGPNWAKWPDITLNGKIC